MMRESRARKEKQFGLIAQERCLIEENKTQDRGDEQHEQIFWAAG